MFYLLWLGKPNKMRNSNILMSPADLELAEKSWVNQIKTDGSFHFETTGKIYGLGYGPKYSVDAKINISIGQFSGGEKILSK